MRLLDTALALLKTQPYWKKLEPVVSVLVLYGVVIASAYQYVVWRHGLAPELDMFLRSYIVKQVTIITVVLVGCLLIMRREQHGARLTRLGGLLQREGRSIVWRGLGIAAVTIAGVLGVRYVQPKAVSSIEIAFLSTAPIDKAALAYILYELNARQESWHYDVRLGQLNPRALRRSERERCASRASTDLCMATVFAGGQPLIGITQARLGEDSFWQVDPEAGVGVVSTFDWERFAPPSIYEFLTYAIIVQSTLIHLAKHCGGLPDRALQEARTGQGDLFAFVPGRRVIKAQILAGRLTRDAEELLLNCFGARYLRDTREVLALRWLREGEVRQNLQRAFGVEVNASTDR